MNPAHNYYSIDRISIVVVVVVVVLLLPITAGTQSLSRLFDFLFICKSASPLFQKVHSLKKKTNSAFVFWLSFIRLKVKILVFSFALWSPLVEIAVQISLRRKKTRSSHTHPHTHTDYQRPHELAHTQNSTWTSYYSRLFCCSYTKLIYYYAYYYYPIHSLLRPARSPNDDTIFTCISFLITCGSVLDLNLASSGIFNLPFPSPFNLMLTRAHSHRTTFISTQPSTASIESLDLWGKYRLFASLAFPAVFLNAYFLIS